MTNNIKQVLDWLDLNRLEWFSVSTTKGDNTKVFDSIEDETLAARLKRFEDTMQICTGGRFIIKAKRNQKDGRGGFELEFENRPETSGIGSAQPATIQGVPEDKVQVLIAEALEKAEQKRKVSELERENKELKKEVEENGGAFMRILKKAEPVIGMLIDRAIPQKQIQIAGYEPSEHNTDDVDQELTSRIETAVMKWSEADEDFIQVLEFIAEFAATGEKIDTGFIKLDYATVKGMLLKK